MLGKDLKLLFIPLERENAGLLDTYFCGNDGIDWYIKEKAASDLTAVTTMVVNAENNDVICIYSLCCSSYTVISHGLYYPYPAVEIKIFAMNKAYQDIRYSDDKEDGCLSNIILDHIIGTIFDFTDNVCGANFITLYSTEEGYEFYKRNGFGDFIEMAMKSNDRFTEGCYPMYMVIR